MSIAYDQFEVLTFDCYGTLIDWETGLLRAMRVAIAALAEIDDDALLADFGRFESAAEAVYQPYRGVLAESLRGIAAERGLALSDEAAAVFGVSVRDWPAFPDSAAALARLKTRFKLAVITNCDTDLFAASNVRIGVEFDWVISAEMARSYKPNHAGFELAFATIQAPKDRILHVAQSLFHDHVPAKELGMTSVWIDRRHGRSGPGATPPATTTPDAVFPSMAAFAETAVPEDGTT
jgi:2-haloacid dehalogenase